MIRKPDAGTPLTFVQVLGRPGVSIGAYLLGAIVRDAACARRGWIAANQRTEIKIVPMTLADPAS